MSNLDRSITPGVSVNIHKSPFSIVKGVRTYPHSPNVVALQLRSYETLANNVPGKHFFIAHAALTVEEAEALITNLRAAIKAVRINKEAA